MPSGFEIVWSYFGWFFFPPKLANCHWQLLFIYHLSHLRVFYLGYLIIVECSEVKLEHIANQECHHLWVNPVWCWSFPCYRRATSRGSAAEKAELPGKCMNLTLEYCRTCCPGWEQIRGALSRQAEPLSSTDSVDLC